MAIRWGILGCGDVTEVKSGPALQKANGSALVAVMRRDGAKAADFAKRHGVPRWYDDAEALIADRAVDAVYVATPPSSHLELALKVAAARKPCYVEKPMARNANECRQMIEAFETNSTPLFVAYYRRALPAFVEAKRLIDNGAVGRATGVSYRFLQAAHRKQSGWRTDPAVAGAGLFLDLGSHALNAIDWIVGPISQERGDAACVRPESPVEELVTLQFRIGNGTLGVAQFNFASDYHEDRIEITGTDGRLSWACFGNGELTLDRAGKSERFSHPPPPHVHQPLVQTIADELSGRGKCPSDGRSGARTSQILDAAIAGFYASRL